MEIPDLSRTVEASVPIRSLELGTYLVQLRSDVLPHVRALQAEGKLRWYCFLIHPASQLLNGDPNDGTPVIHLRFEPVTDLSPDDFIKALPQTFEKAVPRPLEGISGLDPSILCDGDWARGWHLVGKSSEWVLAVLEDHQATPTPQQLVQLMHFVTDGVGLGGSCLFIPGGSLPF